MVHRAAVPGGARRGAVDRHPAGVPSDLAVGPLDNDELVDIAVTNMGDDTVSILINAPTFPGQFTAAVNVTVADQPRSLVLADLDRSADHEPRVGAADVVPPLDLAAAAGSACGGDQACETDWGVRGAGAWV